MPFSASRTSYYLEIIKGERNGIGPALVRTALAVPEYLLYRPAASAARYYRLHGPAKPWRAPCPVISIGNITAGGTGKTPMVEWLVQRLKACHRRPAVLSRGYRATSGTSNDESQLLSGHLGDVPVLTGKDRSRSAREALQQKLANVFVLDDGFQHYAMARDLDIVLIDCLLPFGGGHLLPRGLLREPLSAIGRAHGAILTRCDHVPAERRRQIRDQLCAVNAALPIAEAVHEPQMLLDSEGRECPLDFAGGRKLLLFSGIGNPEGFEKTAASLGCTAAECFRFRDHHRYFDHELTELGRQAEKTGCDAALTTEKDLVKIGQCWKSSVPLLALRIRFEIVSGEEMLGGLIEKALDAAVPG